MNNDNLVENDVNVRIVAPPPPHGGMKASAPRNKDVEEKGMDDLDEFFSDLSDLPKDRFVSMKPGEGYISALKRLDPSLVYDKVGKSSIFNRYTTREGEIRLATRYGHTLIIGPGNHTHLGIGIISKRVVKENQEEPIVHNDLTLFKVHRNEVAVIECGKEAYVCAPGHYCLRQPLRLVGVCDIKGLDTKHFVDVTTEELNGKAKKVKILAGESRKLGGVTFARSRPGFCCLIQTAQGRLLEYSGLAVMKGHDTFIGFVDQNKYQRSTSKFEFPSADMTKVEMQAQCSWQIHEPSRWYSCKGAFEDPFDFIEEMARSLFRDEIGKRKSEKILGQRSKGFAAFEDVVVPKLKSFADGFGVTLLSLNCTYLDIPQITSKGREMALQQAEAQTEAAKLTFDMERQNFQDQRIEQERKARAERELAEANDAQRLDETNIEREIRKLEAETDLAKRKLEADKVEVQITGENETLKAEFKAMTKVKSQLKEAEGKAKVKEIEAAAKLILAKAEAEAEILRNDAKFKIEKEREMLQLEAFNNPAYLQFKLAELQSQTQIKVAEAYAKAIAGNANASILPVPMPGAINPPSENQMTELNRMIRSFEPFKNPVFVNGFGPCNTSSSPKVKAKKAIHDPKPNHTVNKRQ